MQLKPAAAKGRKKAIKSPPKGIGKGTGYGAGNDFGMGMMGGMVGYDGYDDYDSEEEADYYEVRSRPAHPVIHMLIEER